MECIDVTQDSDQWRGSCEHDNESFWVAAELEVSLEGPSSVELLDPFVALWIRRLEGYKIGEHCVVSDLHTRWRYCRECTVSD